MSWLNPILTVCLLAVQVAAQPLSFTSGVDVPAGVLAALGDLTQDGRAEAICITQAGIGVHFANLNGTFAPAVSEPILAASAALFDLNGDGTVDPVCVYKPATACAGEINAALNLGPCAQGAAAAFMPFSEPITNAGCFAGPERVLFDGQRLWIWEPGATRIWWYDVTPVTTAGGAPTITPAGFWFPNCGVIRDFALLDLNGDADLDVVLACSAVVSSPLSSIHTFLGSPAGPIPNPGASPIMVPGIPSMAVADVNGDSLDDVVATVSGGVGMLRNLGPSMGGVATGFFSLWSGDAIRAITGDFDGDADLDIVLTRSSQTVSFLMNDGQANYVLDPTTLAGLPDAVLHAADLNADGVDDVVVGDSVAGGLRSWLSLAVPITEPRPGTLDGVILESMTGVGSLPASGPLGAFKHALPGTFVSADIVATPSWAGEPVMIGVELFSTGCPPTPFNGDVWVSFSPSTVVIWDTMPSTGIYSLVVGVDPSLSGGISAMVQGGVLSSLALNGLVAITPAHELQF